MNTSSDFWPSPVAHLAGPYLQATDEHVVIAEITDKPVEGYPGMRQLYAGLIPVSEVDVVTSASGGIGWRVESWGPHPDVPPNVSWDGSFWIDGQKGTKKRYEALVHGWDNHNRTVMIPDNSFLMCYGLVPRVLRDGRILWDDPQRPVYDVVEVRPLSNYEVPRTYSPAGIRVLRQYLEDYASLKGCAVVAVYYEKRLSCGDPDVAQALGSKEAVDMTLPGRWLRLQRVEPRHFVGADQQVQIWGCRLILKPTGRPISDESEPVLQWPDLHQSVTLKQAHRAFGPGPFNYAYVSDKVLMDWEARDEFSVYPLTGGVSYGEWWSVSCSRRFGRHHVAVELNKLYEETPPYVVKHFHRYAVSKAEADRDRKQYGDRHIGNRAEDAIDSFLALTGSLAALSAQLSIPLDQEDFCGLTAEDVRYHGWWNVDGLKELGYVVPLNMAEDDFLGRCMRLFQLLERLRPGPIKQLLHELGFKPEDFGVLAKVGALRLLGTLCQFAVLAQEQGLELKSDFLMLRALWDKDRRLPIFSPLFALLTLRHLHGHAQGRDRQNKLNGGLGIFTLDAAAMKNGWGLALDIVYDEVALSLQRVRNLIVAVSH